VEGKRMKYDDEFKREVVNRVFSGQKIVSIARDLGVSESLIYKWKREIKGTNSDEANELIELKKKLREVEMENEILKKAALIFGRGG
jgi:transposase